MIYQMQISVAKDRAEAAIEHRPVLIETMTDGGVLAQTEQEQEMVAEAFKQQVLDLIRFVSPPIKTQETGAGGG